VFADLKDKKKKTGMRRKERETMTKDGGRWQMSRSLEWKDTIDTEGGQQRRTFLKRT